MNGFTNAILTLLLGWLRSLFTTLWTLLGSDGGNAVLGFLRANWKALFLILCVGGFVVDRIIYLLRWRPYYVWQARHARRRQGWEDEPDGGYEAPQGGMPPREQDVAYNDAYARPESDAWQPQPTARYQPRQANALDAPTYRYSPPPQRHAEAQRYPQSPPQPYAPQPFGAAPQVPQGEPLPYTPGASYAPTAAYEPVYAPPPLPSEPYEDDLRFDDDLAAWNAPKNTFDGFAPHLSPEHNLAYGMDSTFGAPQPEPAQYLRDVQAGFAPQPTPEQRYAPPRAPAEADMPAPPVNPLRADHPGLDVETIQQNIGLTGDRVPTEEENRLEEARANFSPFAAVSPQDALLNKPRGLGALAKKARTFVSGEDERNPRTIRDLQPTTDIRSAFRAPVYPQKPPGSEDDA